MELRIVKRFEPAGALHSPLMNYLRRHYSDVFGPDIELLDEPGGLEELQRRCHKRCSELSGLKRAA